MKFIALKRKKLKKRMIKIFQISHKEPENILKSPIVEPILTGLTKKKNKFCALKDSDGDNISSKNIYYAELSAHYYIWKNYLPAHQPEYIGFCHYRRILDFLSPVKQTEINEDAFEHIEENIFKEVYEKNYCKEVENVTEIIRQYDVCTPRAFNFGKMNIRDQFSDANHPVEQFDKFVLLLLEFYPHYEEEVNLFIKGNKMVMAGLSVMKAELFEEFCEWIFPVLLKMEEQTDLSVYENTYNVKLLALLHERFFNVWLDYKKKNDNLKVCDFLGCLKKAPPVQIYPKKYKVSFLEKIFSVKNQGKHKVIRIIGLKIKFRRRRCQS